jgi:peptidoglycan hydrolase-like protein with peptidoglycan-binding domain
MQVLRQGSSGPEVTSWQNFLIGQGYYWGKADGSFGPKTIDSTQKFQRTHRLTADGVVARLTWAKAIELGYGDLKDDGDMGADWPPRPDLLIPTQAVRERMFGKFKFEPAPIPGNPEKIKILDNWFKDNMAEFEIPQLKGVKGAPADGKVWFHKKVGPKAQTLFAAWERSNLMHLVLTWDGSYASRFIRGSRTTLSAHSHGSAFDINAKWNALGVSPPLVGQEGSVRKLVPLANQQGWFFGGHMKSRPDGMHFEVAR